MQQLELFKLPEKAKKRQNPMLKWGKGPDGKKCKTCGNLIRKQYSKVFYKCKYRGNTNGPATDHFVNWPACEKYFDK